MHPVSDSDVLVEITASPAEADKLAILHGLFKHNTPFLGDADFRPLAVLARRRTDLVAGLYGETGRGFLRIDNFWVAPAWRNRSLGSRLIQAAETEAVAHGCHSVWLSTYDFQARPFYERHGYRVFGTLEGFSNGHANHFLTKRLDRER